MLNEIVFLYFFAQKTYMSKKHLSPLTFTLYHLITIKVIVEQEKSMKYDHSFFKEINNGRASGL